MRYSHLSPNFKKSAVELLGFEYVTNMSQIEDFGEERKIENIEKPSIIGRFLYNGRVAELADARDLKSRVL